MTNAIIAGNLWPDHSGSKPCCLKGLVYERSKMFLQLSNAFVVTLIQKFGALIVHNGGKLLAHPKMTAGRKKSGLALNDSNLCHLLANGLLTHSTVSSLPVGGDYNPVLAQDPHQ